MRYAITHRTIYQYNNAVSVSHHLVRLRPRELPHQHVSNYELTAQPVPTLVDCHLDYFGNTVSFVTVEGPHLQFTVESQCQVEIGPKSLPDPNQTAPWEMVRELCQSDRHNDLGEVCEFAFPSPLVPLRNEFVQYALLAFVPGRPLVEAAMDLTRQIHQDFKFDPTATTVATPLEQVFKERRGVCQDFAHLQIACLRALGLPARYISGYLETVPPPGKPKLVGADASHAWVQLWCGEVGWVDLDPTNNLLPGERHVTLAWGRDFADVSPVRGVLVGSGSHQLKVAVDVVPVSHESRFLV